MSKKTSLEKNFEPQSPNELDRYIKVTHPSVWVVLALCLVVLAAAFAWGVLGRVNTTISGYAMCVEDPESGEVEVCMFATADQARKMSVGNTAVVDGVKLEVGMVSDLPASKEEANIQAYIPSDYLRDVLFSQEWGYYVGFVKPGGGAKYEQLFSKASQEELSAEEAEEMNRYSDFSDCNFTMMEPLPVTVVTRSIAPISLVLG